MWDPVEWVRVFSLLMWTNDTSDTHLAGKQRSGLRFQVWTLCHLLDETQNGRATCLAWTSGFCYLGILMIPAGQYLSSYDWGIMKVLIRAKEEPLRLLFFSMFYFLESDVLIIVTYELQWKRESASSPCFFVHLTRQQLHEDFTFNVFMVQSSTSSWF